MPLKKTRVILDHLLSRLIRERHLTLTIQFSDGQVKIFSALVIPTVSATLSDIRYKKYGLFYIDRRLVALVIITKTIICFSAKFWENNGFIIGLTTSLNITPGYGVALPRTWS